MYVRSQRAGKRVKESITRFLHGKLKLKVNESKSAVDSPCRRKFLGFSFIFTSKQECKISIAHQALSEIKDTIRRFTRAHAGVSMRYRIERINQYLTGWIGYFALCEIPGTIEGLEGWLRRRLRLCMWTQWKKIRTKIRMLKGLGLQETEAIKIAMTRKGAWRIASSPPLHNALDKAYFEQQGLKSLIRRYNQLRESWRTAGCGTACPVV